MREVEQNSQTEDTTEQAEHTDTSYDFYLLLQQLKAGAITFAQFIEQAAVWATAHTAEQ